MEKLSVTIITKNEEQNIERCLESIKWADEIIVVDSGSTDETINICLKYNSNIYEIEWLGFGKTKRFAVDQSTNNWILSIDADEVVTKQLKNKIIEILKNPKADAYKIKRKSFYLGKLINHSGWQKDYPLRLFNKLKGNFNSRPVHEGVKINGRKLKIEEYMLHYTYPTITSHLGKINNYTQLSTNILADKKRKITLFGAIFRGKVKFLKMYILQQGFLDGKEGFILALNSAYGVFLKYLKLWELNKNNYEKR